MNAEVEGTYTMESVLVLHQKEVGACNSFNCSHHNALIIIRRPPIALFEWDGSWKKAREGIEAHPTKLIPLVKSLYSLTKILFVFKFFGKMAQKYLILEKRKWNKSLLNSWITRNLNICWFPDIIKLKEKGVTYYVWVWHIVDPKSSSVNPIPT